jgi:hypothetical protein
MQLGTRWAVGAAAPDRLPPVVRDAIAGVDAELLGLASADFDPTAWRWTLTWLEGRPIAELDDGTVVRLTGEGTAVVTPPA